MKVIFILTETSTDDNGEATTETKCFMSRQKCIDAWTQRAKEMYDNGMIDTLLKDGEGYEEECSFQQTRNSASISSGEEGFNHYLSWTIGELYEETS